MRQTLEQLSIFCLIPQKLAEKQIFDENVLIFRKIFNTYFSLLILRSRKQLMQQMRNLPSHESPLWVGGHVQLNVLLPFMQVPPLKHGELVHSS